MFELRIIALRCVSAELKMCHSSELWQSYRIPELHLNDQPKPGPARSLSQMRAL